MESQYPNSLTDCGVIDRNEIDPGRSIVLVPKSHHCATTEKQRVDYQTYRKQFLTWLLKVGKNEEKAEGYSPYTVYATGYRTAAFDRWMWEQRGGYRIPPKQEDATAYIEDVAFSDRSQSTKGKIQEALGRYSRWLSYKYGMDEWEFSYSFDGSGSNDHPADFLTIEERQAVRQAALNEGSIPAYSGLTVAEREQWGEYIAQVMDKPFTSVRQEDWNRVGGWKITSLVWTSLDAGLRPVEVGRAKVSWVDTDNDLLRIPKEESSKNRGNWLVSLTDRTSSALERWLKEREYREKYEGTDALWLTRSGNPYASQSLSRLLKRLCREADISTDTRQLSWYAIRHSVGTYMTKERDLAATKAQLRHKNAATTMKYDRVPVEDRQDALDRM
ncbi:tyrosine-type recombinase/integrase [Halomarina oriensis]|uniref:Tyrosine-type recombinase/integrase n=1 Tax=Halomarina oriensis TaxID=671145 RepID=A0A6B0GJ80_9EURY|nr:site-specific integrase [Halomarina oriensis]MWG33891.1 tyrosine-type recombinase/integrase [Halomarina oriensis]